jgi:hypothetical protein
MAEEIAGAGEALAEAFMATLRTIDGLNGTYSPQPVQAALPYAVVDAGLESDWSHKSGDGREVRIAVSIHDERESPARSRAIARAAEAAIQAVPRELSGWRVVSLIFLRSRAVRGPGPRWTAVTDYRARMLRA